MKYKVIARIKDGIICATKSSVVCFIENSLMDEEGGKIDPLAWEFLPIKSTDRAEHYWKYSMKEWNKITSLVNGVIEV